MPYSIALSEEAEEDILQAYQWYEEQRPGLGDEFADAIETSFTAITDSPEAYSFRKRNVRGCIVFRFPYLVLFVVNEQSIEVVSVFHMHRNPTE